MTELFNLANRGPAYSELGCKLEFRGFNAAGIMAATLAVLSVVASPAMAQQVNPLLRTGVIQDPFVVSRPNGLDSAVIPNQNSTSIPTDNGVADAQIGEVGSAPATNGTVGATNPRVRATQSTSQVGNVDTTGSINPRENIAVSPIEGRSSGVEASPFSAIGIRLGNFTFFPSLDQTVGYTSNADFTRNGAASKFSNTTINLRGQSDWSRHELLVELGATYQKFFNGTSANLPTANGAASLRLDLANGFTGRIGGTYDFATESATSDNLTTGAGAPSITDRPAIHSGGLSAEIANSVGKFGILLRGTLTRTIHASAALSNGSSLSQKDRDNNLAAATARISYQHTPAISPFVEATVGRRIYDVSVDRNGNLRDAKNYALRGGMAFDFGEKLTGEIAVGRALERFNDARIQSLEATTVDATLAWSPMRLTTFTLTAATSLNPSTSLGENGSVLYSGAANISYLIKPELTLTAGITASQQEYDVSTRLDKSIGGNAGFTYWFNRSVGLTGQASYQRVNSTDRDSNYDVISARLGLRLQR